METTITSYSISSKEEKLQAFNNILDKAKAITHTDIEDPEFQDWKILTERFLLKCFGSESIELREYKKLKFQYEYISGFGYDPKVFQNEKAFKRDLAIAQKLISQLLDDAKQDPEVKPTSEGTNPQLKALHQKIQWLGKQKELGELFIELKNKGWIEEMNIDAIQNCFSNSNTIKQILKPSMEDGEPRYDGVYTTNYKKKFITIGSNQRKI